MANGIYTADMGQPPSPPDMGSAPPPAKKKPLKRTTKRRDPRDAGIYTADMEGQPPSPPDMGSAERKFKKGGSVSSASKRADGIAKRGHTRGRMM